MDRLQQMEHLALLGKKLADHAESVVTDLNEHAIIGHALAEEFLRKGKEYQINWSQYEEIYS